MTGKKRIFYKVNEVIINGIHASGTDLVGIKTDFHLNQVFCSCPCFPTDKIRQEYSSWCSHCHRNVEIRLDSCSCTAGRNFIRHLTNKEVKEVRQRHTNTG